MTPTARILLATPAVYTLWAMGWFGVMTFINAYYTVELDNGTVAWNGAMLWFTGGIIVWQLCITEVSARFGRLRTLAGACLAGSIGYLAIPFFDAATFTRWYAPILFVVMGSIPAAATSVWIPMAAEAGGERPGRLLALSQAINVPSCIVVFAAATWLIDHYRFRVGFLAIGATCLISTVLFFIILRPLDGPRKERIVSLPRIGWKGVRELASPAIILILLAGFAAEPFCFQICNQLWPNLMVEHFQWSVTDTNYAVTFGRLPGMLALLVVSCFIDRLNPVIAYGVMVVLTGLMTVGCGWAPSGAVAVAAYGGFHLFQCATWGCDIAALARCAPARLRDAAICLGSTVLTVSAMGVGMLLDAMGRRNIPLWEGFRMSGTCAMILGAILLCGGILRWRAAPPPQTESIT